MAMRPQAFGKHPSTSHKHQLHSSAALWCDDCNQQPADMHAHQMARRGEKEHTYMWRCGGCVEQQTACLLFDAATTQHAFTHAHLGHNTGAPHRLQEEWSSQKQPVQKLKNKQQ